VELNLILRTVFHLYIVWLLRTYMVKLYVNRLYVKIFAILLQRKHAVQLIL